MVKKLEINKFKLLEGNKFEFTPRINAIAGGNGTAKSTLLHLISNSYQKPVQKGKTTEVVNILKQINGINSQVNVKIETLTKGDKKNNSPAPNVKGVLFTSHYYNNHSSLGFRSHNSKELNKNFRFSIKPRYSKNSEETLPEAPVIYLSLNRLFPFGEFDSLDTNNKIREIFNSLKETLPKKNDALELHKKIEFAEKNINKEINTLIGNQKLEKINLRISNDFSELFTELQSKFINKEITINNYQKMGNFKNRPDFNSTDDVFDSNTLSAGEDNLYIILSSLTSLILYGRQIKNENSVFFESQEVLSILLIDEFDASLHPAFQIILLDLFKHYSEEYKIQIIFTTHSLTAIEQVLALKQNLIYLIRENNKVNYIHEPNLLIIERLLKEQIDKSLIKKEIILYLEDNEARIFLDQLFEYFKSEYTFFSSILGHFYIPELRVSSEFLKQLFNDRKIRASISNSICILDGDQQSQININNRIIALPGKDSPEVMLLNYLEEGFNNNDEHVQQIYSTRSSTLELGYQRSVIEREIISKWSTFKGTLQSSQVSTKGKQREFTKNLFNEHEDFFKSLIYNWISNPVNKTEIRTFLKNLEICFRKAARISHINHKIWPVSE